MKIFYVYSPKDAPLREELEVHLSSLKRQGAIEGWHDQMIAPGDDWAEKTSSELESSDVILLLVSADFIASDFCYGRQMKRALELHEGGKARVVPIMLRECDCDHVPFAKIQGLPKDGLPVTSWDNKDSAWTAISKGIRQVVQELAVIPEQVDNPGLGLVETSGSSPVTNTQVAVKSLRHRVTEKNKWWWRVSWVADVENLTDHHILFDIVLEFLDGDGYPVDKDRKYKITIPPRENRSIRGFKLINPRSAKNVKTLDHSIKIRAVE